MIRVLAFISLFVFVEKLDSQNPVLYLFPGQGSDERIFSEIRFDSTYKIVNISYPIPEKGISMKDYALILKKQIDTASNYSFIGVSIGGMLCSELADVLHPKKTIIISSAKCRKELPFRYRFQKNIPIYKLFPKGAIKFGARMLQPIVEPDRNKNKATFKSMLKNKNSKFLKRTVNMIIRWDKKTYNKNIIHIHGTKDHTLPIRKTKPTITIKKGSHMMTLTRGKEIEKILNSLLK